MSPNIHLYSKTIQTVFPCLYWIKQFFLQEVYGYRWSSFRSALMWLGVILTLGALRLVFHWYPQWLLYATHTPCSLSTANKLLIVVSCSLNLFLLRQYIREIGIRRLNP